MKITDKNRNKKVKVYFSHQNKALLVISIVLIVLGAILFSLAQFTEFLPNVNLCKAISIGVLGLGIILLVLSIVILSNGRVTEKSYEFLMSDDRIRAYKEMVVSMNVPLSEYSKCAPIVIYTPKSFTLDNNDSYNRVRYNKKTGKFHSMVEDMVVLTLGKSRVYVYGCSINHLTNVLGNCFAKEFQYDRLESVESRFANVELDGYYHTQVYLVLGLTNRNVEILLRDHVSNVANAELNVLTPEEEEIIKSIKEYVRKK